MPHCSQASLSRSATFMNQFFSIIPRIAHGVLGAAFLLSYLELVDLDFHTRQRHGYSDALGTCPASMTTSRLSLS
jgi:hypothetical protein